MTNAQLAAVTGLSRERVRQLRNRGESESAILAGTYKRSNGRPRTAPRCKHCDRLASQGCTIECPRRKPKRAAEVAA